MKKIIKHKLYFLFSSRFITIFSIMLFLVFNFQAIFNSGILLSGGSDFNSTLKYTLLINNYLVVTTLFGLILCIFLGANIIGPDMYTGNLYILMSICASRVKYYFHTFLSVFIYMFSLQALLLVNSIALYFAFGVPFLWSDILYCFCGTLLNSMVVLAITGLASIYIQGYGSAFVGLLGFAYFSAYTFNEIPFINLPLSFNFAQYKNLACYFLPITDIMAPSITDQSTLDIYALHTFLPTVELYQIVYIFVILVISCFCFQRREL